MIVTLAFYVFAAILLLSACMVITARNPVHSVLFLILAFINAAALFVLAGAEFLAMVLVIVYVGAVAVLFLFVVMMLDVDFVALREGFQRYAPLGLLIGFILMVEIGAVAVGWTITPAAHLASQVPMPLHLSNTAALGDLIYTHYMFAFELVALLLLVAMIGAIVLTHSGERRSRRQDISAQHQRPIDETLTMVKLGIGKGAKQMTNSAPASQETIR
ncbi:MAG TPA: NADH-quinone oxidoreductase subunit J [Acidiphilium sp.]|jgi:NADH-quinone oxidoreductase subunit J|uniref:NADH-quinone oxidoreductase subunit J n=1 Tax=unclassified Acidiphilium TaxID=2617493 RepID=UPI000BD8CAE3|nr:MULTISPECIES: NADH-quinone oxidoreductase subunit J [unclassified Acidiphilium]OYV57515.1 MAG: NADH:ubiquinone oxidoreductase subunit J [Acidiphilium sp. 20-67-58]OYV84917.1 MAG: NADH:ubiquinone oxidoreductase subunit J [Acidiphilium sp. 21-68-69]HQT59608.1 NADH-quinone oxidoreductase subunit J [Acidiphilium sp.]HQU10287.1 NADH-quinone oxidoreductase subunit J [Acidiphilium sp.]